MGESKSMLVSDGRRSSRGEQDWRCRRLRAAMAEAELDALLVFSPAWRRENVRYLTGAPFRASAAFVYLPAAGAPAAFPFTLEDEAAVRQAGFVDDVRPASFGEIETIADRIAEDGRAARLGVAGAELVPHAVWQRLLMLLKGVGFIGASALMDGVRLVKSEWEIEQLRRAGSVCDAAWTAFVESCRPGVREFEIVAEVEANLRRRGAEDNFMLFASGGSDVRGMTPPSERRLQAGDMVRTELTPQWNGYWTQICRTAVVGPPSAKQRASFELFNEAVEAGLAAIRPGVTAHAIAKAENDVFRKRGYGEYCTSEYTRVRGHCLGLHFDEVPILEGVHTVLEENAVLIVHPNTYTPLAGYHVLGDPVVVTKSGAERLIATPRQLDVVAA